MAKRFDDSQSGVINATQIVNFGMWPTEPKEDFGDSWVKLLAKHFEEPLKNAGVDCDLVQIEWDLLKSQVYERFCTQLGMMKLQWKQVSSAL